MIPGPKSKQLLKRLHRVECPHITYGDAEFPIFIDRTQGMTVIDADGNRYQDMTSFFSVSSLGHGAPALQKVIRKQIARGWHGMGDVHPHALKAEAAEAIGSLLPKKLSQVFFSSSGSEAVETALKTAFLHTKKKGVVAFQGAYHGLGYGAMQVTYRKYFNEPFRQQAPMKVKFLPFNDVVALKQFFKSSASKDFGTVIVEPIQGRAGIRPASQEFLKTLSGLCKRSGKVLIFDEIFSGFGRTGKMFAFEHYGVVPDVLCLGKGMSNGFPISACVTSVEINRAWGASPGEAKHTSTFLGHPLGCAMIVATIHELKSKRLVEKSATQGKYFEARLKELQKKFPQHIREVRGKGLMLGLAFYRPKSGAKMMKALLKQGVITLPSAENSDVLSLTPPFIVTRKDVDFTVKKIEQVLKRL